ncbi:MAG: BrnT family toxin [Acidobacteriota bacterium]|nr:BrnT family toxin [Acidobacteriota bacterium]
MKFEWDEEKAHRNILKHGISFDQAITAFDDPFALIAPDEKHSSEGEIREWLI